MTRQFESKVALVTGGSSGIGRAAALAFAREGAKVVVTNLRPEGGLETVSLIEAAGGQALFIQCDVAKSSDVEAMINRAVEVYGRIDCAFNNAGLEGMVAPTAELTEENWDRTINTNLKGVWLCMKHEISHMLKQGRGAIVNCASAVGLVGAPGIAAYSASKHGVVGLTKTAALEYISAGIRINAVCPGVTQTPMVDRLKDQLPEAMENVVASIPAGRIAAPEEVAEAVLWLCSPQSSYVTGHPLVVDGGFVAQ